jgi:hypothetical protein
LSEPAIFALIRSGEKTFYLDAWAGALLFRELIWGPQALEAWVGKMERVEEWDDDVTGAVVVDFDRREMMWHADNEAFDMPRVAHSFQRLLNEAWPGFHVSLAPSGLSELTALVGGESRLVPASFERPVTVAEAIGLAPDANVAATADEQDLEEYEEDDLRAWITSGTSGGNVHHCFLNLISLDLVTGDEAAREQVLKLAPVEIPCEAVVTEGMWIDHDKRRVNIWGPSVLFQEFSAAKQGWADRDVVWDVVWEKEGYARQCEFAGSPGQPLTDSEALSPLLPILLSNQRFDLASIFGALGDVIKAKAVKGMGCLLLVLCLPMLVYGMTTNRWGTAGISIASIIVIALAAFKIIEWRVQKSFGSPSTSDKRSSTQDAAPLPPVAGPLDEEERRHALDALFRRCGFPGIDE